MTDRLALRRLSLPPRREFTAGPRWSGSINYPWSPLVNLGDKHGDKTLKKTLERVHRRYSISTCHVMPIHCADERNRIYTYQTPSPPPPHTHTHTLQKKKQPTTTKTINRKIKIKISFISSNLMYFKLKMTVCRYLAKSRI